MTTRTARRTLRLFLLASLPLAALAATESAKADVEIHAEGGPDRYEGPANYGIEIEPHFSFGEANVYGNTGFGAGLRVGIPLAVGHIGRVPDNIALSFGGDILHYDNCYFGERCGANYLLLPVAAQWNVFVHRRFSLFAEGGAFIYKGWFDGCGPGDNGCNAPSNFGILPTLAIGGRLHIGDDVALTLRVGYPMTTLGISFM
jgi:hypothetical protein